MTKTIEEAARRFAELKTITQAGMSDERNKKAMLMRQFFRYALEELPLSDRLTAAEKESIKQTYKHHLNAIGDCYAHCMVRAELERIFGKDFFQHD